jgi:hypothetical protein
MARRVVHPYGQTTPPSRVFSLLLALAVLVVIYDRARDPATWVWMTGDQALADVGAEAGAPAGSQVPETIVPGPNDTDPAAVAEMEELLKAVRDRRPLEGREMFAYWKLMEWSRTQPMAEIEQRAQKDVAFTQLWEQPEKFRGKPVRMRMHVRRVIKWDGAPKNPLGLKDVYEAWAWTDESKSFPYLVVFPELPPGLPVGSDVQGEIVFVGYFLKIMAYEATDKQRGTPLFVGRARAAGPGVPVREKTRSLDIVLLILAASGVLIGALVWFTYTRRRPATVLPATLPTVNESGAFWEQPADEESNVDKAADSPFHFVRQDDAANR